MKNASHFSQVPQTAGQMDPFPQPQTIPNGWDLTDMLAAAELKHASEAGFSQLAKPNIPETGNGSCQSR
jgi:hypothetical protein